MCGGIVSYLRMCGYDTRYAEPEEENDDRLIDSANEECRTLITRDREIGSRYDDSILLESTDVFDQLQTLSSLGIELRLPESPKRCGRCNGPLRRVCDSDVQKADTPDPTKTDVWECSTCGAWFWRGSHWDRVEATLRAVRSRD